MMPVGSVMTVMSVTSVRGTKFVCQMHWLVKSDQVTCLIVINVSKVLMPVMIAIPFTLVTSVMTIPRTRDCRF